MAFARLQYFSALSIIAVAAALAGCDSNTISATDLDARLSKAETNGIAKVPELQKVAMDAGAPLYSTHCASCHGAALTGVPVKYAPDLTDDNWLYAGDDPESGGIVMFPSDIEKTIRYGIRSGHAKARNETKMPAYGNASLIAGLGLPPVSAKDREEIVEYVLSLSGQDMDKEKAKRGEPLFEGRAGCYDCHGPGGLGNSGVGGPSFTMPAYFLYGSGRGAIRASLEEGRAGVCPSFEGKLSVGEIKAIAVYVFSHTAPSTFQP